MKIFKYIFVFFIVFSSCKSSKAISGKTSFVKELSAKKVAKKHVAENFNKKTIDAKLKVNYKDSKEDLGFSVRMKIKKDEVIWLKGTKIITVFKAKITPEKVSFYSPYKKNYIEGNFSMLKKMLGTDINFQQLQNLLLGQAIYDVKSEKHEVEIVEKAYQLHPKKQPVLFDLFYWVNPSNFKLNKQSLVNEFKKQRLDISYPKYLKRHHVSFPERININAQEKNKFTNINISVRSIIFDEEVSIPYKIPSGYKEIKL
ncbi:uncharacterized protein DUF4292 [Tenacibaculum adriaticum]|uniref:Uncharacterized protein DUF4292 n=1 Tax=Tenacibaculum adriaticum TaxID=413713 RepID=A0A5S5DVL1_9FLAO|nr:DUF4292 domain-containing protein [Tenacibaculum adriaticum]TYP99875.1 uncharacterized protein DUF4292 [Tenacibaculum adriaticum]